MKTQTKKTFDEITAQVDIILDMKVDNADDFWAGQDLIWECVINAGRTFEEYQVECEKRVVENYREGFYLE